MVVLKNILVATDFSEPSNVALDYGRDLARAYGSTLHVLHVLEDLTSRYPDVGFIPIEIQQSVESRARQELDAILTDDDRQTLTLQPHVETRSSIPGGIVDYAKDHQIDLIIVGTHGRGPIKKLFVGSVAERVVRTAPCPVLTVRAHERDFIAPDALTVAQQQRPGQ
jgi:nucleotide-binding universal stress UspA family protein